MSSPELLDKPVRRRRRPARVNERNVQLQQDTYREERQNYAEYFARLGFTGKRLREMVILAAFLSIIVRGYMDR